ncbi:MAG: glycosyltransferase family 2 protein [Desulfonauticus sp.]|nr:glycosyltransferase family 2 protein [Desulfonauticus sp.]
MQSSLYLSVVIPVKNEEENILILGQEVNDALKDFPHPWECLWINDGSDDRTEENLKILCANNNQHRFVSLDKNYGQSAAMYVGFQLAKGKILVTLDGDGQNDPADIPKLISFLEKHNADVVNGYRARRQDSLVRKIASKIGNGFRNFITKDKIRDVGCSIRAMKKECVSNIFLFKGMHRFLPTLIRIQGYEKIMEIPVNHRPRTRGKTKYNINNRLWVGLFDTFGVLWMRKRKVLPKIKE